MRLINSTTMDRIDFVGTLPQQELDTQCFGIHIPFQSSEMPSIYNYEATAIGFGEIGQPVKNDPCVKVELIKKIKKKCEENGNELPIIERKQPEPPKPRVKQEDPATIKKRRERNKIAAMKCRKRKRERIMKLKKKTNECLAQKTRLEMEKRELQKECKKLTDTLLAHQCKLRKSASNPQTTTSTADSKFLSLLAQSMPNIYNEMWPMSTDVNFNQ